jgi:two-component system, NtrC family, sensor histidine kinase PilS
MPPVSFRSGGIEDWRALRALTLYRLVLIGALLGSLESGISLQVFEQVNAGLFRQICQAYAITALLMLGAVLYREPISSLQMGLQFVVDALGITGLVYATGGIQSGLGILLITPMIVAALILSPRMALMCASFGTLLMFGEEFYRHMGRQLSTPDITSTGVLGLMLFASTAAASTVAARARRSEAKAAQAGTELADLSQLNESIIGTMQTGVVVIDADGKLQLTNQAARHFLGDTTAHSDSLLKLAPTLEQAWQIWRGGSALAQAPVTLPGREREVVPRFSPLGHDARGATLILLDDAWQLQEQARQLKLAALGRLSASIAHEIRNPLSAITQAGQLLAEDERLDPGQQKLLGMIQRHGARIERIVRDVLDLARPHDHAIPVIDLDRTVEQALVAYREQPQTAEQTIQHHLARKVRQVRCDPAHLQQVLHNLLENAAEHAPGQPVEVLSGRDNRGNTWLDICDSGPGIDRAMRERIFEPFVTTSPRGIGLGLYLSRELCELNQAQLRYLDQPVGARFRIRFASMPS